MALGSNLVKNTTSKKTPEEDTAQNAESSHSESKQNETEEEETVSQEQFCVFTTNQEEYAIPINLVKEVVPVPEIAKLSQMPSYIIGMSNVRGNIFGVMDLGLFFSPGAINEEKKYLLVLDHEVYQMGIVIPTVPDTLIIGDDMIEKLSTSRLKSKKGQKYLKGIIKKDKRMIVLFDILGMISSENFTEVS